MLFRWFPAVFALLLVGGVSAPRPVCAQNKDLVRDNRVLSDVQKRVALVIGNKDYAEAPLKNPVNDATAMAVQLKELGFDVLLKTNLTKRQMREAVDDFAAKLGPNTIGLFYFSGHGVQVDGANYLVPLSFHIERQADVDDEAYPAQRLLDTMGQTGCKCNIVILDACRNNPLPKNARALGDKGLGKMNAPAGTFIAYATAPGQTASDDGDKANGLYTGILLQKMKTPGLKIEDVFKATLVSVAQASGEKQVPWTESSLRNDFYFAGGGMPSPNPAPVPVVKKGTVVKTRAEIMVTIKGKDGKDIKNAVVTVDNQAVKNNKFSVNLIDVPEKKVFVSVKAAGYEEQVQTATVSRGDTAELDFTLETAAVVEPDPAPAPKKKLGPGAIVLNAAKIAFDPIPGWRTTPRSEIPPELQIPQVPYIAKDENAAEDFKANVILIVEAAPPGVKADLAWANENARNSQNQFANYKKREAKSLTVGGQPAVLLSATYDLYGVPVQNKQVLVIHSGTAYTFTLSAAASDYANQAAKFDKMLQSIEWR